MLRFHLYRFGENEASLSLSSAYSWIASLKARNDETNSVIASIGCNPSLPDKARNDGKRKNPSPAIRK
jgi:hypothetical protein